MKRLVLLLMIAGASPSTASLQLPLESGGSQSVQGPSTVAFVYRGVNKHVAPEDVPRFESWIAQSDDLRDWDRAELLFHGIEEHAPNGRIMRFEGLMWVRSSTEFATVTLHEGLGTLPNGWKGLTGPPFSFPFDATTMTGRSLELGWHGQVRHCVLVERIGAISYSTQAHLNLFERIALTTTNPQAVVDSYTEQIGGRWIRAELDDSEGRSLTKYEWESTDGEIRTEFIGNWPFGLESTPQGQWLWLSQRRSGSELSFQFTLLHVEVVPVETYMVYPSVPVDIFSFGEVCNEMRSVGIFADDTSGRRHIKYDAK